MGITLTARHGLWLKIRTRVSGWGWSETGVCRPSVRNDSGHPSVWFRDRRCAAVCLGTQWRRILGTVLEDTLACTVDLDALLAGWARLVSTVVEDAFTGPTYLPRAAGHVGAWIAQAVTLNAGLAIGAADAAAGVWHTGTV